MQHLLELIRSGDSKDSNFCVAINTKSTFCFVWGLKSSGTRTALEGVIQGSCLTHTKAAGGWWLQSSTVLLLNLNAPLYSSIATYAKRVCKYIQNMYSMHLLHRIETILSTFSCAVKFLFRLDCTLPHILTVNKLH